MSRVSLKVQYELQRLSVILNCFKRSKVQEFQGTVLVDSYRKYDFIYHFLAPKYLRKHRSYFQHLNRGFGEDPFHAAWLDVLKRRRPRKCLEIGVYRGQVISLWTLIAMKENFDTEIWGITPLSASADSVSLYPELDYGEDIRINFAEFNLGTPNLKVGYSNEASIVEWIRQSKWDLIYIDGNHDFEIVRSDFFLSVEVLNKGGLICLDDSSLSFNLQGKFKGHPGPSRVVSEYAFGQLNYLFSVGHLNFFSSD